MKAMAEKEELERMREAKREFRQMRCSGQGANAGDLARAREHHIRQDFPTRIRNSRGSIEKLAELSTRRRDA